LLQSFKGAALVCCNFRSEKSGLTMIQDEAVISADEMELTIVMPCLNEARTLAACIGKALTYLKCSGVAGEVLIADNGSTDGSQEISRSCGARVVDVAQRGYGSALKAGIAAARGRFVIMGDSDDSYDFLGLDPFIAKLRDGNDLVMGNRFAGGIKPGAMPPLHRYLGNPVLTFVGRLFFGSPCRDFHCGLRGFRRSSILGLDLQAPGMEFASEMVIKAAVARLRITEVPTTLSPDGRGRPPHLNSWRDGWRHLRLLLLFSPRWLFLYPGLTVFALGLLGMAWLLPMQRQFFGASLDIHSLLYASLAVVLGFQTVFFWIFAKIYGMRERIVPKDELFVRLMSGLTLERGLIAGVLMILGGIGLSILAIGGWIGSDFGPLSPSQTMRIAIPATTLLMIGVQTVYASFFVSFLGIRSNLRAE
jgi:glycosyltransferase involved in cell wall biosynthesis